MIVALFIVAGIIFAASFTHPAAPCKRFCVPMERLGALAGAAVGVYAMVRHGAPHH